MFRLENWSMVGNYDPYKAPETIKACLTGKVYGHSKFKDGSKVTTSYLIKLDIKNGTAITYSGTEYVLGKADKDWELWLEENNYQETLKDIRENNNQFN